MDLETAIEFIRKAILESSIDDFTKDELEFFHLAEISDNLLQENKTK